ncbi:hypothetical protein V6N13_037609 [Hibiscus sabdariffa]|uniref:Uncharacterized protein n=2 Tax=Hibiscus sabdariffa TaxID=183260 RepID=A0ABR2S5D9_9ROSI
MISRQQPNGVELVSSENPNTWMFDDYSLLYDITVSGGDLPSLDPSAPIWSSNPPRVRSGTCTVAGSKACREKMKRKLL